MALVTTAGLHRVGDDPFAHGRQGPPQMIGPTAGELARPLLADHVDAVCLVPI